MADDNKRSNQRGAEVVRRAAAQTTGEVMRRGEKLAADIAAKGEETAGKVMAEGDAAMETAARRGPELAAEAARTAAGTTRGLAEAGAEVVRRGGEAGVQAARTAGEAVRENASAATDAGRQWMEAMRAPAEMWTMMAGPGGLPGNVLEMQQSFASFINSIVRSNIEIGQEMLRLANPAGLIEMQQRAVRGYLDMLVSGQAALLRTAQHTGNEALRSAEQELGRRV